MQIKPDTRSIAPLPAIMQRWARQVFAFLR
jgi:hypothetical protein